MSNAAATATDRARTIRTLHPELTDAAVALLVAAADDDAHCTALRRHARKGTGTAEQQAAGAALIADAAE